MNKVAFYKFYKKYVRIFTKQASKLVPAVPRNSALSTILTEKIKAMHRGIPGQAKPKSWRDAWDYVTKEYRRPAASVSDVANDQLHGVYNMATYSAANRVASPFNTSEVPQHVPKYTIPNAPDNRVANAYDYMLWAQNENIKPSIQSLRANESMRQILASQQEPEMANKMMQVPILANTEATADLLSIGAAGGYNPVGHEIAAMYGPTGVYTGPHEWGHFWSVYSKDPAVRNMWRTGASITNMPLPGYKNVSKGGVQYYVPEALAGKNTNEMIYELERMASDESFAKLQQALQGESPDVRNAILNQVARRNNEMLNTYSNQLGLNYNRTFTPLPTSITDEDLTPLVNDVAKRRGINVDNILKVRPVNMNEDGTRMTLRDRINGAISDKIKSENNYWDKLESGYFKNAPEEEQAILQQIKKEQDIAANQLAQVKSIRRNDYKVNGRPVPENINTKADKIYKKIMDEYSAHIHEFPEDQLEGIKAALAEIEALRKTDPYKFVTAMSGAFGDMVR